jgi:hypothetical protein
MKRRRELVLAAILVGSLAGCGGQPTKKTPPRETLNVAVASYDLAVGPASRFLIGLLTEDQRLVSGGSIAISFAYTGTEDKPENGRLQEAGRAAFLELASETTETTPHPTGVYTIQHAFDRAGFWKVHVVTDDGLRGTSTFEVLEKHSVPAPGDSALHTENHTLSSTDVPKEAIDSRGKTGDIPDPQLHQETIANAMDQHRPALVVFSTPVYCVSRFCGPITDMVAQLANEYSSKAAFIHIEIWRDRTQNQVNKAAAEWLWQDQSHDLQEPWVFLIGSDGRIVARWDNVATREEIEPLLKQL